MTIKLTTRTVVLGILILLGVFALLGVMGVAGWEYTNSNDFCSNACHMVHPEEPYAHRASQHAEVDCVECHIGRLPTFRSMVNKAGHVAHAWALVVGYERPLVSPSMPPSRDSCEGCHSQQPHQHNSVRVHRHYGFDEANTETKTTLILRTQGRQFADKPSKGIHWHTDNMVRFIATDPQQRNIPWVEATRPDGTIVVYTDVKAPLAEEEIAAADMEVMECVDCHNRSGHPFRNPSDFVDDALARGVLDRRLPYVKARAVELLHQDFQTEEDAQQRVEEAWARYAEDFPETAEQFPDAWNESVELITERQAYMRNLMLRSRFLEPGITWNSFPDHSGHMDSPGCFRCHSGRHHDADGNPIPVNCTLCHSIPLVTQEDRIPSNYLALLDVAKPRSHLRPDFMARHRKADAKRCQGCHEEISYGTDNKTFCANSGCHDSSWPDLDLDAL